MDSHYSTGQAADLVGATEPRLNELVRRRLIDPAPCIVAGRRQWSIAQILRAAELLGLGDEECRVRLSIQEAQHVS